MHDINSNSTSVEAMKNRTEGEMILVRWRALACMKVPVIVPVHQVLDNEVFMAYKSKIKKTNMTY